MKKLPSGYAVRSAPVAEIKVPKGRRKLDESAVIEIEQSIRKIGLRTPITFRIVESIDADGEKDTDYVLVTGQHRLEAFKRIGEQYIPAVLFDGNETDAERWEISENIHRAELTALERAEHVARWIELTEQQIDKPSQVATVSKGGRGNKSGINAAARELGIKKDDAHRAKAVASLSKEAKAAAKETGLDNNRNALLAAAKEKEPASQARKVREIADQKQSAGSARIARMAEIQRKISAMDTGRKTKAPLAAAISAYDALSHEERAQFHRARPWPSLRVVA